MAETKLDILLRLQDQLSTGMKRSMQSVEDFTKSVERSGKEIAKIGGQMAFFGAGITAPFAVALKSVEKFSYGVQTELAKTSNTWLQFNNTIAQAALPTLREFNDVFAKLVNMFNSIDPVLREQIVHWTLIAGAILTVGGTVLLLLGKFIQLGGAIANVTIKILTFNPALTATIAIVGALVYAFLKFHDQFILVVDSLQYAWLQFISTLITAWKNFINLLSNVPGMSGLKKQVDDLTAMQAKLQAQMQNIASGNNGSWAQGINNFSSQVQGVYSKLTTMFNSASTHLDTLTVDMATRMHDLSNSIADGFGDAFDKMLFEGQKFSDSLKSMFAQLGRDMIKDFAKTSMRNMFNSVFFPGQQTESGQGIGGMFAALLGGGGNQAGGGKDTKNGGGLTALFNGLFGGLQQSSQQTSSAMTQAASQSKNFASVLGQGSFNIGGFFNSLQSFGGNILQLGGSLLGGVGNMLSGILGSIFGGMGFGGGGGGGGWLGTVMSIIGTAAMFLHTGGEIAGRNRIYAHQGLAPDEVPIIAQTGEGVLNRAGMNRLGSDNLRRLNRGMPMGSGGGGGVNVYLTQVIQAWDAQDVQRNKKMISSSMVEELRTNGQLRKAVKES